MKTFSIRRIFTPANLAIVIGSPSLVISWHLLANLHQAHLERTADELTSTIEFFGAPVPNHAGTKLYFAQTSAEGITGYIVDIATGKKTFLLEHEQAHLQGVGVLGWSPDDKLFAYSVRSPHGKVVICDGATAKELATIPENKIVLGAVWLSGAELVYVNQNADFTLVRKLENNWHKTRLFENKPQPKRNRRPPVKCLTALPHNSVAWQQGGTIWRYALGSAAPEKIWQSTTNILINFSFSYRQSALLLHCRNLKNEVIFDFYPAFLHGEDRMADPEPLKFAGIGNDNTIQTVEFFGDGLGCACLARSLAEDSFYLCGASNMPTPFTMETSRPSRRDGQTDSPDPTAIEAENPVVLHWPGTVDTFAATDRQLFITGSPTNGPLAIWQYEIETGELHCIVPGAEHAFRYAKVVNAEYRAISPPHDVSNLTQPRYTPMDQREDRGTTVYYLSQPADFVSGRKYPLVIDFTGRRWRAQEATVVNAGCFLASCNGIPNNPRDVLSVYRAVIQNPAVDTKRVYVMGISAGAGLAVRLLEENPELWHGAILLSATYMPAVPRLKAARILMDSGDNDTYLKKSGGVKRLTQFQDEAAASGIPVSLAVHPGVSHVYRSKIAERRRVRRILEFLAADN